MISACAVPPLAVTCLSSSKHTNLDGGMKEDRLDVWS